MKKFLIIVLIFFSGIASTFAEENGHCDIREDNYGEWILEEVRIRYICGDTCEQIIHSLMTTEDLTYEEGYFLVEPVIEEMDLYESNQGIRNSPN